MVLLPKTDYRVIQVTNKPIGGNFVIIAPMCLYEFEYSFLI